MDETAAMMDTMTGLPAVLKNFYTISFFRRLALWGTIMMIVSVVRFGFAFKTILSNDGDKMLLAYHGFLAWSVVSLIVTFIITIIFWSVYMPHYGEGAYNIFQYIGKLIIADLTIPFTIVKDLFTKDTSEIAGEESNKALVFFKLIMMLLFIAFNVIGLIKSL